MYYYFILYTILNYYVTILVYKLFNPCLTLINLFCIWACMNMCMSRTEHGIGNMYYGSGPQKCAHVNAYACMCMCLEA